MIAVGERLVVDDPKCGVLDVEVVRTAVDPDGQLSSFRIRALDPHIELEAAEWTYHRPDLFAIIVGRPCRGGCGTVVTFDPLLSLDNRRCSECWTDRLESLRAARYDAQGERP